VADIAFLRILCPAGVTLSSEEIEEIHKEVREIEFEDIRPAEEYTRGIGHRYVVWRFNNRDTLSTKEGRRAVGRGNILYLWRCPHCRAVVRKHEHPRDHKRDGYYGCSCIGTTWGIPLPV